MWPLCHYYLLMELLSQTALHHIKIRNLNRDFSKHIERAWGEIKYQHDITTKWVLLNFYRTFAVHLKHCSFGFSWCPTHVKLSSACNARAMHVCSLYWFTSISMELCQNFPHQTAKLNSNRTCRGCFRHGPMLQNFSWL